MQAGRPIATCLLALNCFSTLAEYRVYQYYVRAATPTLRDGNSYLVTSTLHPVAYRAYHGGEQSLRVDLLRSWMCFGATARRPICPSPLEELQKQLAEELPGNTLAGAGP